MQIVDIALWLYECETLCQTKGRRSVPEAVTATFIHVHQNGSDRFGREYFAMHSTNSTHDDSSTHTRFALTLVCRSHKLNIRVTHTQASAQTVRVCRLVPIESVRLVVKVTYPYQRICECSTALRSVASRRKKFTLSHVSNRCVSLEQ